MEIILHKNTMVLTTLGFVEAQKLDTSHYCINHDFEIVNIKNINNKIKKESLLILNDLIIGK